MSICSKEGTLLRALAIVLLNSISNKAWWPSMMPGFRVKSTPVIVIWQHTGAILEKVKESIESNEVTPPDSRDPEELTAFKKLSMELFGLCQMDLD